jgi:hypothetical protein
LVVLLQDPRIRRGQASAFIPDERLVYARPPGVTPANGTGAVVLDAQFVTITGPWPSGARRVNDERGLD